MARRGRAPSEEVGAYPLLVALGGVAAAAVLLPVAWLVFRGAQGWVEGDLTSVVPTGAAAALWRSLALSAGVAAGCVLLMVPAAWLTEATDMPGRRFFRIALTLPLAVPSYVSGFVVVAAFGPSGWFADMGVRTPEVYGWFGATMALLFSWPYAYLPLCAAFSRVDSDLWNAARSLGASPRRAFRDAVLPVLRPAAIGGWLLVALYVLSDFGAVSLTRFRTLSYVVYLRYQSFIGREEAVVYAWWLVVCAALLVFVHTRLSGRRGADKRPGARRQWKPVPLGQWAVPAMLYCGVLALYGVGLPVLIVGRWLVVGLGNAGAVDPFGAAAANTGLVSVAGAVVVVVVGLVIALLPGRSRVDRWVGRSVFSGYALPGIVVALALVFFASSYARWVYQTLPLLLLAYLIRFVPLASTTLSEHAARLNPRLVEAARSLGRGPREVTRTITLPLLRPAMWAAFIAAVISIMKELPATLLLAPIEFRTLATHIWSRTEEGFFTAVAPPVLVLVGGAAVIMLLRRER